MAKVLRCKHIGPDQSCQFAARGESDEEILEQVGEHARAAHGIEEVPPELIERALESIREE